MGDEELVGLTKAAQEIGRSREWLRLLIHRGDVKYVQVGRTYGIPRSEIKRLKGMPVSRGGWPKGKPRKTVSYELPGEHATAHLAADHRAGYEPSRPR
jgi:hypothetical protein